MKPLLLTLACISLAYPASASVVVSIKPLHSLVANIMQGSGEDPQLLVSNKQSMHHFSLKPSQATMLAQADIVFYISPKLELFLNKTLEAPDSKRQLVAMDSQPDILLLPARSLHHHNDEHEEHHAHEEHEEDAPVDMHLWLSPQNAKAMLRTITDTLSKTYPDKKSLFEQNHKTTIAKLDALDNKIRTNLAPLADGAFISFHDATQYFEKAYGLHSAGSLTLHPEQGLSAGQLQQIRQTIKEKKVRCIFREPQFDAKAIAPLLEGTKTRNSAIDPEAALLSPSPELYFQLMDGLSASFEACLR